MIEGSRSGSVPLTNGSVSGRPKNIRIRNTVFLASWKPIKTRAGPGSGFQRYGSAGPDPHQNVTNPEHLLELNIISITCAISCCWNPGQKLTFLRHFSLSSSRSEMHGTVLEYFQHRLDSIRILVWNQFCGSRSGIWSFFDPWIWDPRWVKN